ncbi:hypothetical protein KM043_009491 [Ampulex compressa]|nr:hypothetical protein KM043_009491 [Ampulex compressa]
MNILGIIIQTSSGVASTGWFGRVVGPVDVIFQKYDGHVCEIGEHLFVHECEKRRGRALRGRRRCFNDDRDEKESVTPPAKAKAGVKGGYRPVPQHEPFLPHTKPPKSIPMTVDVPVESHKLLYTPAREQRITQENRLVSI